MSYVDNVARYPKAFYKFSETLLAPLKAGSETTKKRFVERRGAKETINGASQMETINGASQMEFVDDLLGKLTCRLSSSQTCLQNHFRKTFSCLYFKKWDLSLDKVTTEDGISRLMLITVNGMYHKTDTINTLLAQHKVL